MLPTLDIFLTLLHFGILAFNLTGWIWNSTLKLHFISILLTAFSWLVLGIWYGWGYCPTTDWQWRIKEKLGERNLPNSFVKYFVDKITGADISAFLIDTLTAGLFVLVAILSVYINFMKRTK